jgi:PhnB protein
MQVSPYLMFNGRAEEAIEFYKKALGAKVEALMRFKEAPAEPGMQPDPALAEKVMHAQFHVGATQVMASDGMCNGGGATVFQGFSLAVQVKDDAEARRRFDALADGGQVQQPLIKTFFASSFGVVADRFGVSWMVVTV